MCNTHVSIRAKHCGDCNRCVEKFDHHCRWLNNCVGELNYSTFFKLIIFVWCQSFMHNVTNMVILVFFYSEHEEVCDTHLSFFGRTLFTEFSILLYIAIIFNIITLLFLTHLILYHIRLIYRGMTTFEYIKEQ